MKRFLQIALACSLALPVLAQGGKDDIVLHSPLKYAREHAFSTMQLSQAWTKVLDAKTKQAVKDFSQSRTLELRQIVLETNANGGLTKILLTVTAQLNLKVTVPKEDAFEQRVELKNVHVDVAFVDGTWQIDTESIRSKDMKSLTGAELHLLRRAVRDALQIHARPDLLLLPEKVAAGTTKITPTLEQLSRWSAAANESGRLVGSATDAEFTLRSIKSMGNAKALSGQVRLLVPVEKESVKATMALSFEIDDFSGLVRQRRVKTELNTTVGTNVIQSTITGLEGTDLVLSNKPISAPTGPFNALGWKVEKDASTWRDVQMGVGLALPKDARQRAGQASWDFPGGGSVSVEIRHRDFWPTLEQVLESGVENLRREELGLKDIKPGQPFRLADGLPAAIVHARSQDGKTAILVLLTADGPRTIAVSAATPATDKTRLAQLEQTLRSLRVTDPRPADTEKK